MAHRRSTSQKPLILRAVRSPDGESVERNRSTTRLPWLAIRNEWPSRTPQTTTDEYTDGGGTVGGNFIVAINCACYG